MKELKAKDLRKGNIVFNEKLDFLNKGYHVLEARDIYELAVHESGQTTKEAYQHFKPIKVTEEWLYKYGFIPTEDVNNECVRWELDGFTLFQEKWGDFIGDTFDYATRTRQDGAFKAGIGVETIHQLQNLYYATRMEELEFIDHSKCDLLHKYCEICNREFQEWKKNRK